MNDFILDIQNIRKVIHNSLLNSRPEQEIDRMFVKSLCGFVGVLSDFEMLYLGRKYNLMDEQTLTLNLDMAKQRITSLFEMPDNGRNAEIGVVLGKISAFLSQQAEKEKKQWQD